MAAATARSTPATRSRLGLTMPDALRASRTQLIESIVAGTAEAHLVFGPFGTGKTELLKEVGARLTALGCTVLQVAVPDDAQAPDPAHRPQHAFRQCLSIAQQIGDQLSAAGEPKLSRAIPTLVRQAQFSPITINQSITATDSASVHADGVQSVELHWDQHLTVMESLLGDAVVSAVSQRLRRSAVAVLFDDIHNLQAPQGHGWLLDVLRRIPLARVIATQRPGVVPSALTRAFSLHRLDPLRRDDVAAYLAQRWGSTVTDSQVDLVCAATGRLPWGVTFVAERLIRSPDVTRRELEDILESAKVGSDLVDLVDASLTRLPPELRHALDRLAVLRDFDDRAAVHMLNADDGPGAGPGTRHATTLLNELRQVFVLEITTRYERGRTRSSDPTDPGTLMHLPDIVRAAVSRQNMRRDPYQVTALHRHAAHFYRAAVEEANARLEDPFGHWSTIEGGVAQRYLSEWIYHVANAGSALSRTERTRILRWYFEGFFWYEWKVPHWFCQRLLEYCEAIRRTNTSVEWLDCVHRLHRHYPRGWRKEAKPEIWRIVIEALVQLRGYMRQPGPPPAEATDASQTYALITHLLGEALYFSRMNLQTAGDRYREAARWYVGESNAWCRTYIRLHLAELELARGDPTPTRVEFADVLVAARNYEDIELYCHALRLRADERRVSGQWAEAVAAGVLAVLHALAYQARQLFLQEMMNFPDAYTREVYDETVTRTSALIDRLQQLNPALAAKTRQAVIRLFRPFWEYDNDATAPTGLFPPPPADVDLGRPESGYVSRVAWLMERRESLLWSLDVDPGALGLEQ